jgi:Ni,Fe-hydrogenase I cytochrome b subunit
MQANMIFMFIIIVIIISSGFAIYCFPCNDLSNACYYCSGMSLELDGSLQEPR